MQAPVKRILRSKEQSVIAGVCGGVAEYFDIDPVLVRLLAITLFLVGGIGFFTYIIAWIIIPLRNGAEGEATFTNRSYKQLYRSKDEKMIAGICGGIAKYFDVDPTIIRMIALLLLFFWGIGFGAYLVAFLIIPKEP